MNSFKRFTAALSALAVSMTSVFTFSVAVAATTFTDASSISSWATDSVEALADSGVLSGRPDGSFDPKGQLNRAEVAKVAVKAAGLTEDTTGAPHFNDVAATDWFYTFVETLYNNGVVGGINGGALDADGLATYNPGGTLNRAEGAKILVDALELETAYAGTPPNFPDVASSAWFYDYVETAYAHGIINGYSSGDFGPGDAITREQIAVIAKAGVDEAADGSKRRDSYTAGAASSVEPAEPTEPTTPTTSDGTLNVALSASTSPAQTFPVGAASTAVAAYDFTASSDDVVITNLVVTRTGVGNDTGWTLYLYDGDDRLTSGKTINSTTHQATFTGVNTTIAAGTTKTLTLKADTSSAGAGDNFFEIEAAEDVTSNAKSVSGSFPVKSNKQEINTSVTAGTITISKTGSITNPEVGSDNITIAKFKLETSNEAGLVEQVAILVDGTISASDVQNAKLFQGDTELASAAAVNSKDLLVFTLDTPYEIAKGDSRNFEVRADLNTGRNEDTIKVYLDESTDLVATGGTYGFGMSVTLGDYDGAATSGECSTTAQTIDDASCSLLQGGDITITSSGPAATDIAVNGDDITMMDFSITSVSEVTFEKFAISLTAGTGDAVDTSLSTIGGAYGLIASTSASGTTAAYTDIKIVNKDTGATLMGPIDSNSMFAASDFDATSSATVDGDTDADGYYYFSDEFTMAAGEELNLALTLDVSNNTGLSGDTLTPRIEIATYPTIKDINNKALTISSSVVPGSDIVGKTMTVAAPTLTIARASSPVSDTFVKGTKDVCFVGFSLAAGDASDIEITELKVDGGSDVDGSGWTQDAANVKNYVGSVELWDGDTKIAGPESVQTDGTATFDNMSYTVEAGATNLLKVCGDISSSIASGSRGVAFAISAAGNITAEDKDGNSVTPTGTASAVASTPEVIMTVSQGGSLTVAVDADTAKEDIVVAGTSDVEISKFKFTTTDEAFLVKKLSINNRQSAVAAATNIGDYDNNVISIKLSYTNSDGATETKTGYLTNGTADFSGLDLLVDKDDDAIVTVSATLQTESAGATAGEFVDLNVAFNDFEAVAQGSGETYTAAKIDNDVTDATDLDFGTISYTDPAGLVLDGAEATVTLGSSLTFQVDEGDDTAPLVFLPNGTIVCFNAGVIEAVADADTNGTCDASTDNLAVITGRTAGTTEDTYTAVVVNDADGAMVTNLQIHYALPGTGYLTTANQMVVYETKPTVALSSSSPSGSRTVAASDNAFIFTISADSQEKVQFRVGEAGDDETDVEAANINGSTTDNSVALTTASGTVVDGTSGLTVAIGDAPGDADDAAAFGTDGECFVSPTALTAGTADGALASFKYVSFWINSDQVDVTYDTIGFVLDAASDCATAQEKVLGDATNTASVYVNGTVLSAAGSASTRIIGNGLDDAWELVTLDLDTLAHSNRSTAQYWGFSIDSGTTDWAEGDNFRIDGVVFHNDMIVVDMSGDAGDFNSDGTVGLTASLKEGGSTVAQGGIGFTGGDAQETGASGATGGKIVFVPGGLDTSDTNGTIEISKGTSKTFTVQIDSATMLDEDAGSDDPLTFSMSLGSSTNGTVTPGNIWWNDTNRLTNALGHGVITWLGQVDNDTLNGNTLKY